ncbi:hypothetical protein ACFTTN_35000 [Streptomyces niveus]|uniref:hypothetical protein n=1 Tax=Streptomyces niveus TaxID=193462 RepID=UPI00363346D4
MAEAAVAFAGRFPSWREAEPEALAAFGTATAALWNEIADEAEAPWKRDMALHAKALAHALG